MKLAAELIYSEDFNTQLKAITTFRKKLSKEKNPPINEVLNYGVTPRFVELLRGPTSLPEDPEAVKLVELIQFEAAWALTNIASGTSDHTAHVVALGTVPIFIQFLSHPNPEIRDQCIWALGNIAGEGPEYRDMLLESHIMHPLLTNLDKELNSPNSRIQLIRNATWALSNLCRGRPVPSWNEVVVALPFIARLIQLTDQDALSDACWCVSYLSDAPVTETHRFDGIIGVNILPSLVQLIRSSRSNIQSPALRTIGNIVTGNEAQTQAVIDCGALKALETLLFDPRPSLSKEACWVISNITAGTASQVQAVIEAGLFPPLIRLLDYADMRVKREACWAICNATSYYKDFPNQCRYLVSLNVIPSLCRLFTEHDPKAIIVALGGLSNILEVGEEDAVNSPDGANPYALLVEECGGIDSLEGLQAHSNEKVYEEAKNIIDKFFGGEEEPFEIGVDSSTQQMYQTPSTGFNF